ncbi:MAG: peptidoglycan DD-metalloendopeptidase family protein [Actinomycetota bacterium]|nr:peptidoglycan DD-metalloendopeptidase family protein [Actinomycetota bacterium]
MRRVSDQNGPVVGVSLARIRRLFAAVMLIVGVVPMSQMAKAAGPSAAVPACSGATYTVVGGDGWMSIARGLKVTMGDLLRANAATTATVIHPGQTLCVPSTAAVVAPPTTTPAPSTRPAAAGTVVAIDSFPVQGPCTFIDTYGAPRGGRVHEGVDIIAKAGQSVYAVKNGKLTKQYLNTPGSLSGYGWRLTTADGTYYFYAHLGAFAPGLSVGDSVNAGQIIGQVGMTGDAPAPHLHFEVHPGGGPSINPTPTVRAVDTCHVAAPSPQPAGAAPSAPAPPPASPTPLPPAAPGVGRWKFISSVIALDTAWTGRALSAGSPTKVRVNNAAGVAPGSSAVLVRISTRDAVGGGYLLAHPCDAGLGSSTLNFSRSSRANGVAVVRVVDGSICVTVSQTTHARVEVIAFAAAQGVGPQPIATTRALDSRGTGRLRAYAGTALSLAALGVPPGTKAVSVTVTLIDPAQAGAVVIGACSGGGWKMSFSHQPVASYSVVVRINDSGLCLTPSVATDLLVDVTAAWTADGAVSPVDPSRLFDARNGSGTIGTTPTAVAVAGVAGVPVGATTALLNVTIVGGVGFVYPCDQPAPAASALAASPGVISAAAIPVRLAGGAVCVSTFAPVAVIVDVIGAG